MSAAEHEAAKANAFRQPRPVVRWLAILAAAAGWYVSLQLVKETLDPGAASPLLAAVCGGDLGEESNDCSAVLRTSYAFVNFGAGPGALRMPAAGLGMVYFAFLLAWLLFVGPPAARGWLWHIVPLLVVVFGVGQSVRYVYIMHSVLEQWCTGCLLAHGLNAALAGLMVAALPWRRPRTDEPVHPTPRLALATLSTGTLLGLLHFAVLLVVLAAGAKQAADRSRLQIVGDPDFIRWDHARQEPVEPFLRADEIFDGDPDAPHTVVVFGDFRCRHCADVHRTLEALVAEHPGALRIAYRHAPQDAECNPDPQFRVAGHDSACAAARAVEAARIAGGAAGAHAVRSLLYERQAELPKRPWRELSAAERSRFAKWAEDLGLDRAAFEAAFESAAAAERIAEDVAVANRLGLRAMPVVYLDWKRVQNPGRRATWEVLLGLPPPATRDAGE